MPFERGHPKYGGRQAGITKSNLLAIIREEYPNFHPILAMLKLANDPKTPVEVQARLLNDVASYTLPKLKPVEFTELQHWTDETISALAEGNREQIDTFIQEFLNGRLSAQDLSSLAAALSLKQKGQPGTDEQAELLRLIKSQ